MNERALLSDGDVRRWHDNLAEGSPRTAEVYLWWLHDYCSKCSLAPLELIEEFKGDKKAAQDRLEDYIRSLKVRKSRVDGKPLKPKSINGAKSSVKSWFGFFELEVTRQIKVGDVRSTPTIEEEHPPSSEELNTILDHGNQRTRATMVLIAYTGIRPEAISRLRLSDFPELEIDGKMQPRKIPMIVKVRAELSKNKRLYFMFMGKRGIEYLVAYFEERIASGEKLTAESPAITVPMTMVSKGKLLERGDFMGRKALSALMRRAIRSSNTSVSKFRPYMLRGYYDWALQNAGLNHVWEQFFMGHSGPIEEEYSVRKRLTDEQVEKMRAAFSEKVEPLLAGRSGDGMTKEQVEKTFELKHYWLGIEESPMRTKSPEDILKAAERWRSEPLTVDEKIAILREEYQNLKAGVESMMEDHDKLAESNHEVIPQKVIEEPELGGLLQEGWVFVASLPSGRIVVRR